MRGERGEKEEEGEDEEPGIWGIEKSVVQKAVSKYSIAFQVTHLNRLSQ
jgi:hypothetical protein